MAKVKAFINGRICFQGKEWQETIYVNESTGMIMRQPAEMPSDFVDLKGKLLAPAYLELQTNGGLGFHFTNWKDPQSYRDELERIARHLLSNGVGAFYVTLPTVHRDVFEKILPYLKPCTFNSGADMLGAHCEGPWLNPSKKGAHDATLMQTPSQSSLEETYGGEAALSAVKMVTLAPELEGSTALTETLSQTHNIVVSLGHSEADYDTGQTALQAGATALTHVYNAMPPLHHRTPGLTGLITSPSAPYYSLIADGIHLHPAILTLAYRCNPTRCVLITDAVEMAGMPDGVYPGHAQVPHPQRKQGNRVTIEGTETLIGSCCGLDECVRNLAAWSECGLPAAVRCATENIAGLMGLRDRGVIEEGRRADFVALDDRGGVLQTWIKGVKVFDREGSM